MLFYPILGWGVFWVGFILAIILFAKYKKLYPVFYMISVALYVFTAGFVIDVFNLGQIGILSIVVFLFAISLLVVYNTQDFKESFNFKDKIDYSQIEIQKNLRGEESYLSLAKAEVGRSEEHTSE